MAWQAHRVVFRLRSPLHIGRGKVGNLQRTHPYVTGRVLWGALTARLTRDAANNSGPAADSREYQRVGGEVNRSLAYTYLYPATFIEEQNRYVIAWPWEDGSAFRRRFLGCYAATALVYPQQTAAEGTLHEVEFISPHTLDTGAPVFLCGYIFQREGCCNLAWPSACERLQLGGERGYGWGDVELIEAGQVAAGGLFELPAEARLEGDRPVITFRTAATPSAYLLAHAETAGLSAAGEVEPLIGREWRSNNRYRRFAGQHVEYVGTCFAPGSRFDLPQDFEILNFAVWRSTGAGTSDFSTVRTPLLAN